MNKTLLLIVTTVFIFIACNNNENKDKYEQTKQNLEQIEKESPEQFLMLKEHDKKNLLGQTVISGTLTNKAKVCTYKDIELQLSFYSKTGVLLEEDKETVFEIIAPGNSKNFKTKYFAPKGTDSVAVRIVNALVSN